MKTNDKITSSQLAAIINANGAGHVMIDGNIPEEYKSANDLFAMGMNDNDIFTVEMNYGDEVKFHLVSDESRVVITTGLKGRVENAQWVA